MWLIFALLAPLLFAIVIVIDSYCVEDIFDEPWVGVVTGAFATLAIIVGPLPIFLPFVSWHIPSTTILLLAFVSGVLIQFSQVLYFHSLSHSEAGIIGSYWNLIPIFVLTLDFIFLGRILSVWEYIGIALTVSASTYVILLDTNIKFRHKAFLMMLAACIAQAITYVLLDYAYEKADFGIVFYTMTAGLIASGVSPILLKTVRQKLSANYKKLQPAIKFFLIVELFNILALASAEKAIDLGNPALVAAIETTIPAFTIFFSIFLLGLTNGKYGDTRSRLKMPHKLIAICGMFIGVWFIS